MRLYGAEQWVEWAVVAVAQSHAPAVGAHVSLIYGAGAPPIDRNALREELVVSSVFGASALALAMPSTGHWHEFSAWELRRVVALSA